MNYIYLHGFASGPKSKKAVYFKKLFKRNRIELSVPDLNAGNFAEMTLSGNIALVEDIIKKTKGPVTLIGSSLGGYTSAIIAERNLRIKQMILMAPAFEFVTKQKQSLGKAAIASWKSSGFRMIDHHYYNEKTRLNYTFYKDALDYEKLDFKRSLPVTIFHGLHDETVPYEVSIRYAEKNPSSRVILSSSDHSLASENNYIGRISMDFLGLKYSP